MGLFGAKDMSGYWSAGRGAICCGILPHWLSDWLPHWLSDRIFVPPVSSLKIDHLSILVKEMNIYVHLRRISYLKSDHWSILVKEMSTMGAIFRKMAVFLKENALRPNVFRFFIEKVIICWFSNKKWAKRRNNPNISGDPILSAQRIPRCRGAILCTQRIPRGRELILSTQRIPRRRDPICGRYGTKSFEVTVTGLKLKKSYKRKAYIRLDSFPLRGLKR